MRSDPTMKKLVIFDLDGTLVNTIEDVCRSFNDALEACGFTKRDNSYIASLVGKPLEEIIKALLPEGESSDIVSKVSLKYREIYHASDKPNTKPYPGITELLNLLQKDNIAIGVNSNKAHEIACDVVNRMFPGIDIKVSGYGDAPMPKPSPEGAKSLMDCFGVSPRDTIYVGDTRVDVDTAQNAGVDCIVVTWGQGGHLLYQGGDGYMTVATAGQLKKIIEKA